MESARTAPLPAPRAPLRGVLLPALLPALLLLTGMGCGHSHDESFHDPGYGSAHEWVSPSIDGLDGYVRIDGRVEIRSGLEVTEGGSISFLGFDVSAIPLDARVTWAELVLWTEDIRSYGGPVELTVSSVDYGPSLDRWDPGLPSFDSRSFTLGPAVRGASIGLDLTALVRYEIESGASMVGLRLDAFGGDLLFEDGGSNLGSGAVPLLSVAYEW